MHCSISFNLGMELLGIFDSARNFGACVNLVAGTVEAADAALNKKYLL